MSRKGIKNISSLTAVQGWRAKATKKFLLFSLAILSSPNFTIYNKSTISVFFFLLNSVAVRNESVHGRREIDCVALYFRGETRNRDGDGANEKRFHVFSSTILWLFIHPELIQRWKFSLQKALQTNFVWLILLLQRSSRAWENLTNFASFFFDWLCNWEIN